MTDTVLSHPGPDEPREPLFDDAGNPMHVGDAFVVDDDSKATWAMRKLLEHRKAVAEIVAIAEAEIARIQSWADEQASQHTHSINYFEGQLTRYALVQRGEADRKTISTPYGKVKTTATQPKFDFAPEFLEWAKAEHPEWVRVKEEVALAVLRDDVTVEDTPTLGLVAVSADGEILPGVTVTPAGVNVKVEVDL